MKSTFGFAARVLAVLGLVALVGCGQSTFTRVGARIWSMGDLGAEMVNVNLIGTVGFDEDYVGNYGYGAKNVIFVQGVGPESPEYSYRVARVNLRLLKGALYKKDGQLDWIAAAMVPDHLPALKAWDLVEVRQTGTRDTLQDFSATGEANAVLRILCRKSDPNYESCAEALPRIGEYRAQGYTGAPYLKSLKDYGYTFTPAYDTNGKLLRPLPL